MIDLSRSSGIFDPLKYKGDIHIVGVGATGSHVCENLILHGISGNRIHVYDYDKVEEHNVANQIYTLADVGLYKVDALQKIIAASYKENIVTHKQKVTNMSSFKGVVFLLIDGSRGPLVESMAYSMTIPLIIETGLDARICRAVTINPLNINHINNFMKEYGSDDDLDSGEVSICGTRQVVSATVKILASLATWEFIHWVNNPNYCGNKTLLAVEPWYVHQREL